MSAEQPPPIQTPARPPDDALRAPVYFARLFEIITTFIKLGSFSFGGAVAHLGYLRNECVTRRGWLSEAEFVDLMALCQFLPGPASSQLVFALGMRRAGILGALAASLSFLFPSALLMISLGYGISSLGDLRQAGWLHGLKLTALAVVAQAVWGMGQKLCADRARLTICLASAACLLAIHGTGFQIAVLLSGAFAGWLIYRSSVTALPPGIHASVKARVAACAALLLYGVLLVALPILSATINQKSVAMFDSFYRSGALVFGGGHVVLPLLRSETVPRGWLSDDQFLAGYGAAQAVPGPLFSFAGFLGTIIIKGPRAWQGGVLCLAALFLPGWLLIGGALPFWERLRSKVWMQAALQGANASVVGILIAALYTPVFTESVRDPRDLAAALIAFGLLEVWKLPPWSIVLAMAGMGQWFLG